jgi:CubicO group peptidase (beta-lactamase class C family)
MTGARIGRKRSRTHRSPWFGGGLRASVLGVIIVTSPATGQTGREPVPSLDRYVKEVMAAWRVPGLSLAIVRGDSIVYAQGYGVRTHRGRAPVDDRTVFAIGSSGKAFTATLAAMLVSDGKMRWDDRLTTYLPSFRLYDAYANSEVTVRDALTHRSGLSRGELVWAGSTMSRDEVLHRLRFLRPSWSFRSRFGYSNIMYLAAGEAAGRAGESPYEDLIRRRIFEPLGMTRSLVSPRTVDDQDNIATAHATLNDTIYQKPLWLPRNIAPAGLILSTARDMAQWVRFQLADGVYGGTRLLTSAAFRETHRPQTIIAGGDDDDADSTRNFATYGIGWFVEDYRNHLVWQHGGNTDGMTAMVAMLPERKFGLAILSNMAGSPVPRALMRYLFDRELGFPARDWSAEEHRRAERDRAREDSVDRAREGKQIVGGRPTFPLDAYTGIFADSLYGELSIRLEQGRLVLERGYWKGPLEYWNGSTFRWNIVHQPGALDPYVFVRFDTTPDATVNQVSFGLPGETATFTRKPERRAEPP